MALFPYILVAAQNISTSTAAATNLYAWGAATSGQLGINSAVNQSQPVVVSNFLNGQSFASIVAGRSHTLALDTQGGIWTWGDNTYGQLGNNTTISSAAAVKVQVTGVSWAAVGTAGDASLAITTDGFLYTWGRNDLNQLGDGTIINRSSPAQAGVISETSFNSWSVISTGANHTFAIRAGESANDPLGATLWAWGINTSGQLGLGTAGPATHR
jgi:alpha-tubulin suppressor-like RCC1 family protein